jgi:predicted nucleic acid-binding protein
MPVLVDTSIWIDYFRKGKNSEKLDFLIDENLLVVNDLILAELIPFLKIRNQPNLIKLLHSVNKLPLAINWGQIVEFQFECLKKGINGIGIPDLVIAQNARQNHCALYSLDSHFRLVKDILAIQLLG